METELFSTREIAVGVWIILFAAWTLRHKGVREGLLGVLRALVARQILTVILLAAAYVSGLLAALHLVGLWTPALAKDSLLWFLFSGPFFAMSVAASRSGEFNGSALAREAISAMIVVEYITSSYTFSLPVELVLVPVLTVIGLLNAVAETREEFIPVRKLFGGALAIAGIAIFAFSVRMAVADYTTFGKADTWRSLALAPLLSLLFVPFVYCLALYSSYETLFLRLRFATRDNESVGRYARRRLIRTFGVSLARVQLFQKLHVGHLFGLKTRADVDQLVESFGARASDNRNAVPLA